MALALKSNVYSDIYITGNCIVTGTMTTLANPVNSLMTILQDQKPQGTTGGTNGTGWQTRTLNTTVLDQISVSLGSNQFTLPAGTYHVQISTPACQTNNHRCRLYNVTTSTVILLGTSECAQNSNPSNMSNRSFIDGYFTSVASGTYRIDQYFQTAYTSGGLGMPSLSGGTDVEIYTTVKIIKINSGAALNQWTTGGTAVYYSTGNVGIGTATPDNKIDVANGSIVVSPTTFTGSSNYGIFFRRGFSTANYYNCSVMAYDHNGDTNPDGISINGYDGVSICTGSNARQERMRVTQAGLVGIGTAGPVKILHGYAAAGSDEFRLQSTAVTIGMGINAGNNFGFLYNRTNNPLVFGTNDAERMRITETGLVGIGTASPGYALDVINDINCSGSFRQAGILQPKVPIYNTFTGVTTFDTTAFDLTNYNSVEIRVVFSFNTLTQNVTIQALDTVGTVLSANEAGYQSWRNATTPLIAAGTATVIPYTETVANLVGSFLAVIKINTPNGFYSGNSTRVHAEWDSVGCYAGAGATTTLGRCVFYVATTNFINRIRFNLSSGTMTGRYSVVYYV